MMPRTSTTYTRFALPLLTAALLTGASHAAAQQMPRGTLLVANMNDDTVWLLDTEAGEHRGRQDPDDEQHCIRPHRSGLDHMERVKGSIEPGKLADFCVLENDILTVDPHEIKDLRTAMTIIGGKVVYDAGLL